MKTNSTSVRRNQNDWIFSVEMRFNCVLCLCLAWSFLLFDILQRAPRFSVMSENRTGSVTFQCPRNYFWGTMAICPIQPGTCRPIPISNQGVIPQQRRHTPPSIPSPSLHPFSFTPLASPYLRTRNVPTKPAKLSQRGLGRHRFRCILSYSYVGAIGR